MPKKAIFFRGGVEPHCWFFFDINSQKVMKGTVYRIKDDDKSYSTKCKEYKMTKGKHDLLLRIVKTLGAIMITVPFALCWYLYYGKDVVSPFYAKGNFMMIALFFVLFIVFGRVYGAFLM